MESLLGLAVLLTSLTLMDGQRAPCYECEDYKGEHPMSSPYNQVRSHCSYPCACPSAGRPPACPSGVSVVRDGCGCCPVCARQAGQPCDGIRLCDEAKGLICQFATDVKATAGVCKAIKGRPCTVYNQTYDNGETFMLDCRTQCACKNGTYACASLCPQENISPRGSSCRHPRLVEVPGQCCREWMCDSETAREPPECRAQLSPWSACSSACGLGLSRRVSNLTPDCRPRNETRLCQLRSCRATRDKPPPHRRAHHIRKGHECKATQRLGIAVHLAFGECRSRRRYRPRTCGECGGCCGPELSTTVRVEFLCRGESGLEDAEPGSDLWRAEEDSREALDGGEYPLLHSYGSKNTLISVEGRQSSSLSVSEGEEAPAVLEEREEGEEAPALPPVDNALSPDDPPLSRLILPTSPSESPPPHHRSFPAKHVLSVDVEWVLKCQCSTQCLSRAVTSSPPRGLLHRVHRTAPP